MKKKKVHKTNSMLAIFMGGKMFVQNKKIWWIFNGVNIKHNAEGAVKTRKLKFHKSWDWLMPVCEKIRDDHSAEISKGTSYIAGKFDDLQQAQLVYHLEKVYSIVREIIKYKKENKNK